MKKSIFYSLLLGFSIIAMSCGDDSTCDDGIQNGNETSVDCGGDCPGCETTVAEDQANIQKTFDDLLMCVEDFKNSRSVDIFFRNFLKLTDGDALNEDWIEDLTDELDEVVDVDQIEDTDRLDLSYHAGTHIYDHVTQSWSKVNNVDDKMVFLFPSEPALTTNNVELVMDKYTDQQVTIDGETIFLPTSAHAIMNVDNQRMAEVDLIKVVYADNANYEIPVEVVGSIFLDPLNITVNLQRNSTTDYEFVANILDGDNCSIKIEVDVELKDDDFENLSEDGFEKVHVKVNVGRMTIQSLADLATLIAISEDDVSDTQINSLLDIDALFDGVKIADIEISEEQETVFIFYKDLSSEDSKVYYESFWEDVEDLWDEFFG